MESCAGARTIWQRTDRISEVSGSAKSLGAFLHDLRLPGFGVKDPGSVPPAYDLVQDSAGRKAVSGAKRQVIDPVGIDGMGSIEEGRAVVHVRVEAGRQLARRVLHCADLVQRLGQRVVEIERKTG